MNQLEIKFLHDETDSNVDPLCICIEMYPEIDMLWMPMRVFIGDKMEDCIRKEIVDKK